jgi:hypothetical protein
VVRSQVLVSNAPSEAATPRASNSATAAGCSASACARVRMVVSTSTMSSSRESRHSPPSTAPTAAAVSAARPGKVSSMHPNLWATTDISGARIHLPTTILTKLQPNPILCTPPA